MFYSDWSTYNFWITIYWRWICVVFNKYKSTGKCVMGQPMVFSLAKYIRFHVFVSQLTLFWGLCMQLSTQLNYTVRYPGVRLLQVFSLEVTSYTSEKNSYTDFFRKRLDSSSELFLTNQLLTVYEMHICDLLNFTLKTLKKNLRSKSYLKDMLCFESLSRVTRFVNMQLLKEPFYKTKIKRYSMSYRATRLYNILKRQGIITDDLTSVSQQFISSFYHQIKYSYILDNRQLVKFTFKKNVILAVQAPRGLH